MTYAAFGDLLHEVHRAIAGNPTVLPVPSSPLYPARIATLCADIASALACLHDKGIYHLDVKPGNILLAHEGQVLLSDFGIAFDVKCDTGNTLTRGVGTASYASPEQALGAPTDHRSDIFSLGAVLYDLLYPVSFGRRRGLDFEFAAACLHDDVRRVCKRALEPVPSHRYDTALSMERDLRQAALKMNA